MVSPTNTHSGVFKTGDCDNLNHKKSNLVNDELHGVAISLSNNLSQENLGVTHNTVLMNQSPSTFKILPDHLLCNNSSYGSYWSTPVSPVHHRVQGSRVREEVGINHISGLMSKEELQVGNVVTRSGFHSSQEDASPHQTPNRNWHIGHFPRQIYGSSDRQACNAPCAKVHTVPQLWSNTC